MRYKPQQIKHLAFILKPNMTGNNFLSAPPVFIGENYQILVVKMKSYLQACDLWDLVETDPEDTTIA